MKTHLVLILFFLIHSISSIAQTDLILVDFGNTPSPSPWNNMSNPKSGQIDELTNSFGIPTEISLTVIDSFNYINTNGTTMPNSNLGIVSSASEDSFYGNAILFADDLQPTGGIRISNLDINKQYTISIFSSRLATDNRETQFEISGMTIDTTYLNVSNNTDDVVSFLGYPSLDGNIEINATTGPNNNNTYGFYYLGALKIEYPADSIVSPNLTLLQPNGGEFWQVDKTVEIKWSSTIPSPTTLEYSIDNGDNWNLIETIPAFQNGYNWTIPNTPSDECLVRITSDTLLDISDSIFEISSDTTSCPIVVIGSSTAAGTGVTNPDNAWVNRFREAVFQNDTRYPIINLAQGGYTTYHLLPTGNPLAGNVGITIDTERNISKALSFNPSGIIINLPSNDAANFFSVQNQLTNFQLMVDEASLQGVDTWVCTTQPRNFSNAAQIQLQLETRDSIFSIYGNKAIDFWNGFADVNGFILPEVNSGDGVHLNDDGHQLLFDRVYNKSIPDSLCNFSTVSIKDIKVNNTFDLKVFPNPFQTHFQIEISTNGAEHMGILLYDIYGRKIFEQQEKVLSSGNQSFTLKPQLSQVSGNKLLLLKVRIFQNGDFLEKVLPVIYY